MSDTEIIESFFVTNIHLLCIGLITLSIGFLCCQKVNESESESESESENDRDNKINNIIIIKNLELPPPYKPER